LRGEAEFSAARLRGQLRPWSIRDPSPPPDELDAYRRFYGFSSDVDHLLGTLEIAGQSIVVQALIPAHPVATAVVIHGYYDHVGLFVYLIEHLLSRNVSVLCCDLPGHGLSSGDRVTIDSFDTYVEVVRAVIEQTMSESSERLPKPLHLLGQSMGGSIVMEYVEQHNLTDIRTISLFAPLLLPHRWVLNRWVFMLARPFVTSRPRGKTSPTEQPEFRALRAVDPLQAQVLPVQWVAAMVAWEKRFERYPVRPQIRPYIIQGTADQVVSWRYNLQVLRRRYQPVVLELPHATHHLVNEAPIVRQQMWAWLDEHIVWGDRAWGDR